MANNNMVIQIDDGVKKVPIQNKQGEEVGVFYFNPTDIGIIDRFNELQDTFPAITEPLQKLEEGAEDVKVDEAYKEATKRLYEACDKLFNGNFSEAFFGKTNPFSPVDGEFYCEKALNAVGKFVEGQFNSEVKKISAKAKKYLPQDHKRAKK